MAVEGVRPLAALLLLLAAWAPGAPLAPAPAPASAQGIPNLWQGVLSHVRSAAALGGSASDMVSSWDRVADSLRRSVAELRSALNQSVSLAEAKVREVYMPTIGRLLRWQVDYAMWMNPDVSPSSCPEDPVVAHLLKDVEAGALECVRGAVPPGHPDVEATINVTLTHISDFLTKAHAVAEECDGQPYFQSNMCKATRLAPMAGALGLLGSETGRAAGQLAVLVDGSARECVHAVRGQAQRTEEDAQAAAFTRSECIKWAGGNRGSPELEHYYENQVLAGLQVPSR